jgi:hypothetical protein
MSGSHRVLFVCLLLTTERLSVVLGNDASYTEVSTFESRIVQWIRITTEVVFLCAS